MSSAASHAAVGRMWQSPRLGLLRCAGRPCQTHLLEHARVYLLPYLRLISDVSNIVIVFIILVCSKVEHRKRSILVILVKYSKLSIWPKLAF